MFGLLDCNNFYVSCERVFRPELCHQPVIVLSNNDGCVVARSNEVKALGIRMGVPLFEIKDIVQKHHIHIFSSNYTLYGDMSARVMSILRLYIPQIEVYSIDESFLDLHGIPNLEKFGRRLVQYVTQATGIPVSLGIAPTKTLAKAANKFAKKYKGYQGCCLIDSEQKRQTALQKTLIGDIWGIGRRIEKRLTQQGILTAADFCELAPAQVRDMLTVTGERLWRELNGQPCLELETLQENNKQICNSRSFGEMTGFFEDLSAAVAAHAMRCAEKLRAQKASAEAVITFIQTNRFRTDLPQYCNQSLYTLPCAGNDSLDIVKAALSNLKKIYKHGFLYKKCGVIIPSITPSSHIQGDLFDTKNRLKSASLMACIDKLNKSCPNAVNVAAACIPSRPKLNNAHISQRYTTNLKEIITITV